MHWRLTRPLALTLLLAGCSPALNWRSMPLPEAALTITLPCKPDRATRTVELAGAPTSLSMVGCDADGATFAVSYATLADPVRVGPALTHWRAAVLANMGPRAVGSAVDTPFVPPGAPPLPQSVRTLARGQRADGSAVVAQGVWFARPMGSQMQLGHAVVYTREPRPDVADTFFAGLTLQ